MSEQRRPRYTMEVRRGTALVNETAALLRVWDPGEPLEAFEGRVLRDDVLGKSTARRVKDLVRRVFARRYLLSGCGGEPARALQRLLLAYGRDAIRGPALLHTCRADALLYDATLQLYWPAVRAGQLTLTVDDVLPFLRAAERDGRIPTPWSDTITPYVAHGVLSTWTGFGLLGQRVPRGYRLAVYRLDDRTTIYLAYLLHFEGCGDMDVVGHSDWALFGLQHDEVIARLHRLANQGWWEVQAGGGIVRLVWPYGSMVEVEDALTR